MSAKDSQSLKQLQSRLSKLEVKHEEIGAEVKEKQEEWNKVQRQLSNVKKEIKALQKSDPIVSEHAVIRYMEKEMGLDIEQIKQKILGGNISIMIKSMGNGKFPIGNGMKAIVKDNTIVTIV